MSALKRFGLQKSERLKSNKLIRKLYNRDDAANLRLMHHPFFLIYRYEYSPEDNPFQVLFGVSRKSYKTKVQRNRHKRHSRELFRLQKPFFLELLPKTDKQLCFALIYIGQPELSYSDKKDGFDKLMEQFLQKLKIQSQESED